jgi:hypothetical protein
MSSRLGERIVGLDQEMSAGGGGEGWEPVLGSHQSILLCPNSVNNILYLKLDNRQSPLHPPAGGRGQTQGLLDFVTRLTEHPYLPMVRLTSIPTW